MINKLYFSILKNQNTNYANKIVNKKILNNVKEINSFNNFNNILKNNNIFLIFCFAKWCNISKRLLPNILYEYSTDDKYFNYYNLFTLDIEKFKEVTNYLNIKQCPSLLLIHSNNVIDILQGDISKNKLESLISDIHIIIDSENKYSSKLENIKTITNNIFSKELYYDSLKDIDNILVESTNNKILTVELNILKFYIYTKTKNESQIHNINKLLSTYNITELDAIDNRLKNIYLKLKSINNKETDEINYKIESITNIQELEDIYNNNNLSIENKLKILQKMFTIDKNYKDKFAINEIKKYISSNNNLDNELKQHFRKLISNYLY